MITRQTIFHFSLVALLFVFSNSAHSQETSSITLEDAIQLALKNSKELKIASTDELIANEQLGQTSTAFLPNVTASYVAAATNNPLNAFGFKLQQQSITSNDFNPALLNHPSDTYNLTAMLEIKQPMLNIDMIYQRKAASKQTELYKFKKLRTQEYITFEVQKAFMQLQFAHQAKRVIKEALASAQSFFDFTHNRFDHGLIQKSDLLNAQVQVTTLETKLAEASSAVLNASDYLGLLMGKDLEVVYVPTGQWTAGQPSSPNLSDSRADFLALSKAIEASQLSTKSRQSSLIPRINAFASYQYSNPNFKHFGSGSYLAGVQLSWNIFNGLQTRHKVKEQRLITSKLQTELAQLKERSELEVVQAQRAIIDSKTKIIQHEKAVEQSEESLRILQNRYEKGLVNTTDILLAQAQLSQQQLNLEQAMLEQNVAQAYLFFLTASYNSINEKNKTRYYNEN